MSAEASGAPVQRSRHVPTRDDVVAAAKRLPAIVCRTPCVPSPWLSDLIGADVRFKLECVQPTGSFKIRGAANALARLRETRPGVTRVVTASAGNHGQAVALAASRLGLGARVFVPASAPAAKRDSMRRLGADVVETASYDAAETEALAAARSDDDVYVPPYNDPDVIAGAGTIALEIIEDVPDVGVIVAPLGGGGLISGLGIVAASRSIAVVAAEAEASPVFAAGRAAGRIVTVEVHPTLADGLAGNLEPGSMTFDLVRALTHVWVSVTETQIAEAMAGLIRHERLIVEGASATAVVAAQALPPALRQKPIVVVLSGRNVDSATISRVLSS